MIEILPEHITELHLEIWREFETMPGQRLTLEQACRLFSGQPRDVVVAALRDLVDASVLREIGPYYVRADWARFTA